MSRKFLLFVFLIIITTLIAGCPESPGGNSGNSQTSDPPPVDPPNVMFDGVEIQSLMNNWFAAGESPELLEPWLEMSYPDGGLKPCLGWHIRETNVSMYEKFDLELDPGTYFIQGYSGTGLGLLVLGVAEAGWEPGDDHLAVSELEGTVPMVEFELEEVTSLELVAEYIIESNQEDTLYYLWVLYSEDEEPDL